MLIGCYWLLSYWLPFSSTWFADMINVHDFSNWLISWVDFDMFIDWPKSQASTILFGKYYDTSQSTVSINCLSVLIWKRIYRGIWQLVGAKILANLFNLYFVLKSLLKLHFYYWSTFNYISIFIFLSRALYRNLWTHNLVKGWGTIRL